MSKIEFKKYEKIKKNIVPLSEGLGKDDIGPLYYCENCGDIVFETVNKDGKEVCAKCLKG